MSRGRPPQNPNGAYWAKMLEAESKILREAMTEAAGDVRIAAKILGITRNMMYMRLDHCKMDFKLMKLELALGEDA